LEGSESERQEQEERRAKKKALKAKLPTTEAWWKETPQQKAIGKGREPVTPGAPSSKKDQKKKGTYWHP